MVRQMVRAPLPGQMDGRKLGNIRTANSMDMPYNIMLMGVLFRKEFSRMMFFNTPKRNHPLIQTQIPN